MKKFYKIIFFIIIFIFLTTFNNIKFNSNLEKKNSFFKIENIVIKNNYLVKENKIKAKLKKLYNKDIFFINSENIKNSLLGIDYLSKIDVKKKYPNTIIVTIYETDPIAILFKNKKKYILDSESNLILLDKTLDFNNLPNIFGKGAEVDFLDFLKVLNNNNFPNHLVTKFYYFQVGRWDLHLINGKIIKYPSDKVKSAIIKSIKLLNRKDFLNYKIIDLRVAGKIIVE
jgi:cell division protein FtsQ